MGSFVTHHFQDVVHGSLSPVVHVVHTGTLSEQQIHYIWIHILAGHVQRSVFVLVLDVEACSRLQQPLAHLIATLQVLQLLRLRAGGVKGSEALIVLFV